MNRLRRGLIALIAVLGMAAAVLAATPATAVTLPRVQANIFGWSGMTTRPGTIRVVMTGGPTAIHLAWRAWTTSSATTRSGTIETQPYCGRPIPQCPVYHHTLTVYLHDVRTHRGSPYFAKMRWTYHNARGTHVIYWLFHTFPGGTVPSWDRR
jgi:hypothetical protein